MKLSFHVCELCGCGWGVGGGGWGRGGGEGVKKLLDVVALNFEAASVERLSGCLTIYIPITDSCMILRIGCSLAAWLSASQIRCVCFVMNISARG